MTDRTFATEGKTFEPFVHEGEDGVMPLFGHGESMTKVASSLEHVPELKNYINKAQPEDGWYTLLIHANGTDEVWGGNKRADAFPEKWLNPQEKNASYGYKTFEKNAMGYVHHRNTPDRWTGRILMAAFSRAMGRVELIAKFNMRRLREEGTPYFADMLEGDTLPAVSMGCRVPYDICSICGNKAPNERLYCDHLKFQRLATLEDGRRVRMFNPVPVFHDISLVGKPADPAARVLLKIAEDAGYKMSAMEKKTPIQPIGGLRRIGKNEYAAAVGTGRDPDLTLRDLVEIAKVNKHASYSTLTALGILLRSHEFAAVEAARSGDLRKAAEYYESKVVFPVYNTQEKTAFIWVSPDTGLADSLLPNIPTRSVYLPPLKRRLANYDSSSSVKNASSGPPAVSTPEDLHYAYSGYRKCAEDYLTSGFGSSWVEAHPLILTSILGCDIPLVFKQASLDDPGAVFGDIVRGAYLPLSNL